MKILITGGTGYIGSHTAVSLSEGGHEPIIVDNLSNSSERAVERIEAIIGRSIKFYRADVLDADALEGIFRENDVEAVIHFAGLKAVGESVQGPLSYYENNVCGTINLLRIMGKHNVKRLVFSSSACVYGDPESVPVYESFKVQASNPYGRTKIMVEDILKDLAFSDPSWKFVILRYFNPIGAHESGLIGESPNNIPNNLLPYISQVAVGKLKELKIFGDDYDTVDGTGVRDYLHVMDLAKGHVNALSYIDNVSGCDVFNLGTGKGVSVLEIVKAFSKASGINIPYTLAARRAGDIATVYANADKARRVLKWTAERSIERMCADAWNWQTKNPDGY